jgi:hypothetical protein
MEDIGLTWRFDGFEAVEPYRSNGGYELPGLTQNTLATPS